jgi:hypothetical protein
VDIRLRILQTTSCVVFHANSSLDLSKVTFSTTESEALSPTFLSRNEEYEQVTVGFNSSLLAGSEGTLSIAFEGLVNTQSAYGFFLSENEYSPASPSADDVALHLNEWAKREKKPTAQGTYLSPASEELMFATQFEP